MKNICEWQNCSRSGNYKAPVEKDNSKNFQWLCEEHIKEFNKKWNYFEGMTQSEFDNFLKSDLTWHRPTQEFSSSDNFFNILWNNALNDKFKIFENKNTKNYKYNGYKLCQKDREAFKIMDLQIDAGWPEIQKKFKILVKKFHPDKHSGNKEYENKLKKITMAYNHLKMLISVK